MSLTFKHRPSNAMSFNGNQHIEVPHNDLLTPDRLDPFSLVCWFRTSNPDFGSLISKAENTGDFRGYYWGVGDTTPGNIWFRFEGVGGGAARLQIRTTTSGFNNGQWHCCIVTYSGNSDVSGLTIYVDGTAQPTSTDTNNLTGSTLNTEPLNIGARNSDRFFTGYLKHGQYYDYELVQSDVNVIYNGGRMIDVKGLELSGNMPVGYWPLKDGPLHTHLADGYDLDGYELDGATVNYNNSLVENGLRSGGDSRANPYSLVLNGTNQYGEIPHDPSLTFDTADPYTIVFWASRPSGADGHIIAKRNTSLDGWGIYIYPNGEIRHSQEDGGSFRGRDSDADAFPDDNLPHFITCEYDGSSDSSGMSFSADNIDIGSVNVSNDSPTSYGGTTDISIGARDTGLVTFEGNIYWVAVYNGTISLEDREAMYLAGPLAPPPKENRLLTSWCNNPLIIPHSNYSINFDNTGWVDLNAPAELDVFDYDTTWAISLWVKSTDSGINYLWAYNHPDAVSSEGQCGVQMRDSGKFRTYLEQVSDGNDFTVTTSSGGWNDGEWHHVVFNKVSNSSPVVASDFEIWVDGRSESLDNDDTDSITSTCIDASAVHNLGSRSDGESTLTGQMDDVAMFDRPLSGTEITSIYNGGTTKNVTDTTAFSNLIGYWYMGDDDTFPTLLDYSGNSNPAIMTDMDSGDIIEDAPKTLIVPSYPSAVRLENSPKYNIQRYTLPISAGKLGTDYDPLALFPLDTNLIDESSNGRETLSVEAGSESYVRYESGAHGAYMDGTNEFGQSSTDSDLQITGDITVEWTYYCRQLPSSGEDQFVRMGGPSDSSADNVLYQSSVLSTGALQYFAEHSGGTNISYTTSAGVIEEGKLYHCTMKRESSVVSFYLNGVLVGESGTLTDPTGGSSGLLTIGYNTATSEGIISNVKIIDRALSDYDINKETDKALGRVSVSDLFSGIIIDLDANNAVGTTTTDEVTDASTNAYLFEDLNGPVGLNQSDSDFRGNASWASPPSNNDGFQNNSVPNYNQMTLYIVAKYIASSGGIFSSTNSTWIMARFTSGGAPGVSIPPSAIKAAEPSGTPVCVWVARIDGSNSRFELHPDGQSADLVDGTLNSFTPANGMRILTNQFLTSKYESTSTRFIACQGAHSNEAIAKNVEYLKQQYGVVTI